MVYLLLLCLCYVVHFLYSCICASCLRVFMFSFVYRGGIRRVDGFKQVDKVLWLEAKAALRKWPAVAGSRKTSPASNPSYY